MPVIRALEEETGQSRVHIPQLVCFTLVLNQGPAVPEAHQVDQMGRTVPIWSTCFHLLPSAGFGLQLYATTPSFVGAGNGTMACILAGQALYRLS